MTANNYGQINMLSYLILLVDRSCTGPARETRTRGAQRISCVTVTGDRTGKERKREEKNERTRTKMKNIAPEETKKLASARRMGNGLDWSPRCTDRLVTG